MNGNVYILRVDEDGLQFKGYLERFSEHLFSELSIDKEWMEETNITDELSVIANREGAVMGLPLNRALYDEGGNLLTVFGGNVFVCKKATEGVSNITPDDVRLIESRLWAVHGISHGFVFRKAQSELRKWESNLIK